MSFFDFLKRLQDGGNISPLTEEQRLEWMQRSGTPGRRPEYIQQATPRQERELIGPSVPLPWDLEPFASGLESVDRFTDDPVALGMAVMGGKGSKIPRSGLNLSVPKISKLFDVGSDVTRLKQPTYTINNKTHLWPAAYQEFMVRGKQNWASKGAYNQRVKTAEKAIDNIKQAYEIHGVVGAIETAKARLRRINITMTKDANRRSGRHPSYFKAQEKFYNTERNQILNIIKELEGEL